MFNFKRTLLGVTKITYPFTYSQSVQVFSAAIAISALNLPFCPVKIIKKYHDINNETNTSGFIALSDWHRKN